MIVKNLKKKKEFSQQTEKLISLNHYNNSNNNLD